jgi:hypothetical protein
MLTHPGDKQAPRVSDPAAGPGRGQRARAGTAKGQTRSEHLNDNTGLMANA